MYIGANNLITSTEYILENDKMVQKDVEFVPGLLKIINEIIDNSVDIAIKTDFKGCDEVSVKMSDEYIEIVDNGPGIPVKKNDDGEYLPFVCWGYAMSGSNFDNDENRKAIGMNGVGSYCTNVWSKKFTGISDDGLNRYEVTFKNNAIQFVETLKKTSKKGVSVKFYPDLERFGLEKITQTHIELIKQRLINLSMSFPKITFKFNGKKIGVNSFKKYVQMFGDVFEIFESEKYSFAILPSSTDDFQHFSYVNGLNIKDGGTHIDIISNYFSYNLRDLLIKKYKTLKPADIKNKLQVVAFLRDFVNPKFNSQTKEKITNTTSEVNAYFNAEWDKILKSVYKNSAIIDPIVDVFKIKEELKRKQEMKSLSKPKKIKNDKYIPANKENKYLLITEGESACGSLMSTMGLEQCGYYMLKGKPLNAWDVSQQKFASNKELADLYNIIKNENYNYIVFATDQDLDGTHIRALLSGFIHKYLSEFEGRVGILETPVVAVYKNDKIQRWIYSLDEVLNIKNNEKTFYFKGLGSWNKSDLQEVISKDGIEKMISLINFEKCEESLDEWLGNDSTPRKKYILENDFSIVDA
jgi:DNA topoisomerase-2